MSQPLIILGAGASHDFLHPMRVRTLDYMPPLTNGLFNDSFKDRLNAHKYVRKLVSAMPHDDNNNARDLETYLTKLQNEVALSNKECYRQLIALRLYLRDLFGFIEDNSFREPNHYQGLIESINNYAAGKAFIINFNYDLLFERHLPNYETLQRVDDYMSGDIKVIKIHGARNWVNIVGEIYDEDSISDEEYLLTNAEIIHNNLKDEDTITEIFIHPYLPQKRNPYGDEPVKFYLVPSLAIPIDGKRNYICPKAHIDILEDSKGEINKILIIGWKAGDEFSVQLINRIFSPHTVKIGIVSPNGINEIKDKFSFEMSFTKFMGSGELGSFIKS